MRKVVAINVVASHRPNADRLERRTLMPKEKKKGERMSFLVATMSLPAVYRSNDDARTTTAGTPHAPIF